MHMCSQACEKVSWQRNPRYCKHIVMKIGFVARRGNGKKGKKQTFCEPPFGGTGVGRLILQHWLKLKRPVKCWVPYSCQACRAEYHGLQIRHFWVPSWTPLSRAYGLTFTASWWEEEVWEKRVTDSSSIIASSSCVHRAWLWWQWKALHNTTITQPRRYSNRSSWLPDLQQFHSSSLDQSSASPKRSQPLSTKKAVVVSKIAIPFQH